MNQGQAACVRSKIKKLCLSGRLKIFTRTKDVEEGKKQVGLVRTCSSTCHWDFPSQIPIYAKDLIVSSQVIDSQ